MYKMCVPMGKGMDGTDYGTVYEEFEEYMPARRRSVGIFLERGYSLRDSMQREKSCVEEVKS